MQHMPSRWENDLAKGALLYKMAIDNWGCMVAPPAPAPSQFSMQPLTYDNVCDDDLAVMARSVQGNALMALLEQATHESDSRLLSALQDAGRFDLSKRQLSNSSGSRGQGPWPVRAHLALLELLEKAPNRSVTYPLHAVDYLSDGGGQVIRSEHHVTFSDDFRGALCHLGQRTLEQLQGLRPTDWASSNGARKTIASLADSWRCIAGALNEPQLLQGWLNLPREVVPVYIQQGAQWPGELSDYKEVRVFAQAWPILVGSMACIQVWQKADPEIYTKSAGSDENHEVSVSELLVKTDQVLPQVLDKLLLDPTLEQNPQFQQWISTKLIANAASPKWPHLIPLMLERGVFAKNPESTAHGATIYAIEPLIPGFSQLMLKNAYEVGGDGQELMKPHHPARRLSQPRPPMSLQSFERSMTSFLGLMEQRGELERIFQASTKLGKSVGHRLVEAGMHQSLLWCLDRSIEEISQCDLSVYASDNGHDSACSLILAHRARRSAQAVLRDLIAP